MSERFMGKDGFCWFIGVIEDREDPEQMGRVRVRALGFHNEDLNKMPKEDLPWATVLSTTSDPAMNGLGSTPPFLVEGSWVVGFFQDAEDKQHPIVLGSLPGFNLEKPDFSKGFSDPKGKYPRQEGEPDTNRLARGTMAEKHPSLIKRRRLKQTKVPKATEPFLNKVDPDAVQETRGSWDEIEPKSNTVSQYPYNHVHESEVGHVYEVDDTPGGERIHSYHSTGSFEEIHPKGDKMVKVVGNNYEIIMKDSNVLISGNVNVTIEGTKRELVKGDYILEVEGNYTEKIHKNHRVKIGAGDGGGNRYEEIIGNHVFNINQNVSGRVGNDEDNIIEGNESRVVQGHYTALIGKDWTTMANDNAYLHADDIMSLDTTSGILTIKSGSKLNMKSVADMHIKSETDLFEEVATFKVSSTGTTWNHTSQQAITVLAVNDDITMTGGTDIHLNP